MTSAHTVTRPSLFVGLRARRLLVVATLCAAFAGSLPSPAAAGWLASSIPPIAAEQGSEAYRVMDIAIRQLRDPFRFGAEGPYRFDCSGLVYFAFRKAELLDRIGNKRRGATAYLNWFANRGLRSGPDITKAKAGDILIWGKGKHAGLYLGDGWAISALINPYGVRIHRFDKINTKFTDVLHVQVSRQAPG